jgi:DHA2 family multidrug resistance protein
MGNATSLFNLLRNLGGGFGIAGVTTLISRFRQTHINILGANVTAYNPKAQALLSAPALRGTPRRGYATLFGLVSRQATILSYIDVFHLLALIFLLMTPLVLLMKKPSSAPANVSVH